MWLLACALPLQALAALALATKGPMHRHLPSAAARLVLEDFRRVPASRPAVETHRSIHVHDSGAAQRHRHAPADPTVLVDAVDRLQSDSADDLSSGVSPAMFVGLVSVGPLWTAVTASIRSENLPRWRLRTHHPARPERPPRATD